ncbi:hypothetical protein HIM_01028 [Hirsutella minnesotensis 3608]|nr:hypothetical protein HIM_01028 [Hirsutella minnesotensis 3608]
MASPILPSSLWNRAVAELVIYLVLYTGIFGFHGRRAIPGYNQKFRKTKNYHLPLHIATGIFEISRYQIRVAMHGETVVPYAADIFICLVWSWTSLSLVRSLQRGDPSTTRPAYQAGIILRPLACIGAYLFGSHLLYRVCAKALNSFLYARLGIFIADRTGFLRYHSGSVAYAICIPLSAVLGIHEGNVPGTVPLYVGFAFGIAYLNRWVSLGLREQRSRSGEAASNSTAKDRFLAAMLALGFAELPEIKRIQRRKSLSSEIKDEYILLRQDLSSSGLESPSRLSVLDTKVTGDLHMPWALHMTAT